VFLDLLHGKGLRAGNLELLFLKGLRADDCGQKRAKRGVALDLRKGKELAYCDVYFTSKYIPFWRFVNRKDCSRRFHFGNSSEPESEAVPLGDSSVV